MSPALFTDAYGVLGLGMAVVRTAAGLSIGVAAGLGTHLLLARGMLAADLLYVLRRSPAMDLRLLSGRDAPRISNIAAALARLGEHAIDPLLDLLTDPACEVKNFGDALKLGRACDEAGFFWWEDPYQDGGVSQFAHRKLRQMVKTPMLQTEHIRLLEQHVDFIVADATDYVRAGAHEDGGVTGAMKIAHASEGFGLDVELHGPGPVHRHIMSSIRNTNFFELGLVHPKVKTTKPPLYLGYNDDLDGIDSEGNVYAPDGPGIGVPLDWDWIRAHQVDEGVLAEA